MWFGETDQQIIKKKNWENGWSWSWGGEVIRGRWWSTDDGDDDIEGASFE